jgi:diguanylate cyclase (GGDEF)-like protein
MADENITESTFVRRTFTVNQIVVAAMSLAAIAGTYVLSTSALELTDKTKAVSAIIVVYLLAWIVLSSGQYRRRRSGDAPPPKDHQNFQQTLAALDEASGFFTGSLRSDDALRLVSNKVGDVVPFRTIVLFLLNESRTKLVAVQADGDRADRQKGIEYGFQEGLAGQAFTTRQVETDNYMLLDDEQEFGSSVAIPLRHGENVFGVVQLFFDESFELDPTQTELFESIGSRVAPLMLGSIAYERTQANSLIDATTDLPNERAFYLLLENQVAEAQRSAGQRPLTILAIDIKGFDEINCTFGHVAGDRVLNFVAQGLKEQLRQMDFVARALNDEFLIVLPTANDSVANEIVNRITTGFAGRKLAINDTQAVEVELNIGWSAFGTDGETPGQLMSFAQLRKEQMKSSTPSNVLWFPRETSASPR